jgi:hypothetical protein
MSQLYMVFRRNELVSYTLIDLEIIIIQLDETCRGFVAEAKHN